MDTLTTTNFKEREDSLRGLIRIRKAGGVSILQLASDMGVHEKVLRDFIAEESTKSLNPKNYNAIVSSLSYEAIELIEVDFSKLVRGLDGVNKESVKWEFTSKYEANEIELYKKFKRFIEEDANVIFKVSKKKSLNSFLDHINDRKDAFKRIEKIASYRDAYKNQFNDEGLRVYIAIPIQCLWADDSPPIIILLSTENSMEAKITLNGDKKVLLFNPKKKTLRNK
jgi:hypothetical protein